MANNNNVNTAKLIQKFRDMAERNTLLTGYKTTQKDMLIQIMGTIVEVALRDQTEKMKSEIDVNELIYEFEQMAERKNLITSGHITQEDLLIQIIGTIVVVSCNFNNPTETLTLTSAKPSREKSRPSVDNIHTRIKGIEEQTTSAPNTNR